MKKFILLTLLLFLAACTSGVDENIEDTPTACPPDCSSGSSGVIVDIIEPEDGEEIRGRLAPSIDLYSGGEASADGIVCITGLDEEMFSEFGDCSCDDFYITLDDDNDRNFEYAKVDFESSYADVEEDSEESMTVITRYAYTTYAVYDACITGDPGRDDDCNSYEDKDVLSVSSEGPLTVTSIVQDIEKIGSSGQSVDLYLEIEAKINPDASEQLVNLEDTSDPSCNILTEDEIAVEVDAIWLLESYDCGFMYFEKGEDTASATCVIENVDTNLFAGSKSNKIKEDQWIRLDYAWEQRDSVSFTVLA
tara:strand:+ start:1283 stop:2203 length:921 start_codon:yes stop_codon:yes gene_type:complete